MDLTRVGYMPDPERMASALGATFARYNVVQGDCSIAQEKLEIAKREFMSIGL
jgi:hypothetical protein